MAASKWIDFFAGQAETYEENGFAKHTAAEVDFFLSIFPLSPGASILDVGCGTGRHARALAAKGFRVTGVDFSPAMLTKARALAGDAPNLTFIESDAGTFELEEAFDAALCLCEGGVGLIESGEDPEAHDRAIFKNVAAHLKPNAPFLLTAMNGYAPIRRMTMQHVFDGQFDPASMKSRYDDVWELPSGSVPMRVDERLFIAPEIVRMLEAESFRVDRVLGGTAGHWGMRPLDLDEVEAMFVCRRR